MIKTWFVQCKPFDMKERNDKKLIADFHKYCLESKIFGMGWKHQAEMEQYIGKEYSSDIA